MTFSRMEATLEDAFVAWVTKGGEEAIRMVRNLFTETEPWRPIRSTPLTGNPVQSIRWSSWPMVLYFQKCSLTCTIRQEVGGGEGEGYMYTSLTHTYTQRPY